MHVALTYNVKPEPRLSANPHSTFPSFLDTSVSGYIASQISGGDYDDEVFAEWDAPETIDAIENALLRVADVTRIEADDMAIEQLREARPDVVFNIAEGLFGISRESFIPAVCEMLQLPFTGSDPLTLALCLDKSRAKEILAYHRIATSPFVVVDELRALENHSFDFSRTKYFVKPTREGSGKGIFNTSIVATPDELEREVRRVITEYDQPALIEEFLSGREFTVALLGNGAKRRVLPIIEMTFDGLPPEAQPIYGYESKWIYDLPDKPVDECYRCPAPLHDQTRTEIETMCLDACAVLGVYDWCRIDVRCDAAERPHIIELNPLPGVIPDPAAHSSFPMAARAAGLQYDDIILSVLEAALERYEMKEELSALRGDWKKS